MDIFKELKEATKKDKKKMVLETNKFKGKFAEERYKLSSQIKGNEVKRTGRGSDFEERKIDRWTGQPKGPKTLVEIKSSSTAPLSELQKKTMSKTKNYRVERR